MFGTIYLDTLAVVYSIMLGLLRMLFDSVINILNISEVEENSIIEESFAENDGDCENLETEIQKFCRHYQGEAISIDPDLRFISFQTYKAESLPTHYHCIDGIKLIQSSAYMNLSNIRISEELISMLKYEIYMRMLTLPDSKSDLDHNETTDPKKELILNRNELTMLQNNCLFIIKYLKRERRNNFLGCMRKSLLQEMLASPNNVILAFNEERNRTMDIQYIAIGMEVVSGYKEKIDLSLTGRLILTNVVGIIEENFGRGIARKRNITSNISISELDTNEDCTIPNKLIKISESLTTVKKPKKKKKSSEQDKENAFPSHLCLTRLALSMSLNKRYTKTNLRMVIEKELKPIRDQVSDLRESMTIFSVNGANFCYNRNVQPLTRRDHKYKSILTKTSANKQCLTTPHTTNTYQSHGSSDPKTFREYLETRRKKRSPLAEMYIKLSKY